MNSAEGDGGGAFFESCSGFVVSDNLIAGNSAESGHGGGIFCEHCEDLAIINNTITGNYAHRGGGMNCVRDSNVVVSDNIVSGNNTYNSGAGIRFQNVKDGLVTQNLVSGNWTVSEPGGNGAGIYTRNCGRDVIVSRNIVTENVAAGRGGGFFCRNARTTLINNSAAGNSATFGGGICCRDSAHALLVNTILWGDSADTGTEICLLDSAPCTLTVAYCDVQGGLSGVYVEPGCLLNRGDGNFLEDPIFVDPHGYDLNLRWHSPCIDAGVPDSLDPDGTPSDVGALYFNQDVTAIIELSPHNTPIVIPGGGGELLYDGWIFNFSGQSHTTDIWTYVFVPGGQQYGPIDLYEDVRIPLDSLGRNQITENIPRVAPEGDYVFVAYLGDYPSTITDSSCFYFAKDSLFVGVGSDGTGGSVPLSCDLSQNCPNPFNLTTVITYELPLVAHVKLEVYNLLGQKVATLVNEEQEAGQRSVSWEASKISSGLYFYKLTVGDFTKTKRMMLLK